MTDSRVRRLKKGFSNWYAHPNLWNLQMLPFFGKRIFKDMPKFLLKMRRLSWVIWVGPKCYHKHPCNRGRKRFQGETRWPQRQRLKWWGHQPRNADGSQKLEQTRSRFSLGPPGGVWSCWHLDFSPMTLISDFWLPNLSKNTFLLY